MCKGKLRGTRTHVVEDLGELIVKVKSGDKEAFEPIVRAFQDMAVAYGLAMLGDWQLAQDAAQDAFISAFCELPRLRDPQAFAGWFRRIVIKHIDRTRRRHPHDVALDTVSEVPDDQHNPATIVEREEVRASVIDAINMLPVSSREVVTLYYMGTYSQEDIGIFLGLPVSTVKMRLFHARRQLRSELLATLKDALSNQRPSRDDRFVERIVSFEISTKDIPVQQVISVKRDSYISELQAHLDGSIKTLMVYAQASGIRSMGLPMAIYHGPVREDRHAVVEICLPVAGDIRSTIEIAVKELPAETVAYTTATLRQSIYPGVLKAYDAIGDWIRNNGHAVAGQSREIYLNFNASIFSPTASLDDPCVEIAWPYR
jgi:RNA polymerase sigma factor (sigma-70 family)